MTSQRSREAAYADLVSGLLDLRTDPATERFDAELAAAEDQGRIDSSYGYYTGYYNYYNKPQHGAAADDARAGEVRVGVRARGRGVRAVVGAGGRERRHQCQGQRRIRR